MLSFFMTNGNIFVILFPDVLSLMLEGKKKTVSPFDLKKKNC